MGGIVYLFAYHCEHFESLKIILSLKLFLHYDGKKQHLSPLDRVGLGGGDCCDNWGLN